MKPKSWKPGEKAPLSGQYQMVGPHGRKGPERTIVEGEPFPPAQRKNQRYVLVDPIKTK